MSFARGCTLTDNVAFHKKGKNYKCNKQCKPCTLCCSLAKTLSLSPREFVAAICCRNGKQFPNQACARGTCARCGIHKVQELLQHGHGFDGIYIKYKIIRRAGGRR